MESIKLTLSVKSASLPAIKKYAKEKHTSVSKLVQDFFDEIVEKDKKEDPLLERLKNIELSDDIKALTGVLKGKYPDDMDYKDMKYEYLKDRYGL
ncbi:hypothetical protein IDJ77_13420 [Mucilaginibacter sp. ZT4R22]|uniref:Uncharacterized protein n=1 Tax=Mucilaginibacter pankratovii TaxID=2772110 RepID=A0ABR7WR74_9SPHI|nr:DUF6364 family protein [Mucilaginibacter pankratovii]MBD1364815.1 hypothetical protein [Mucilaginibacter pankratovii]